MKKKESHLNWYVYIIEGTDDNFYTGITTDIKRRWHQHSCLKSGAKYFRGRKPKTLRFIETFNNRSEASKREAEIKKFPRKQKIALILSNPASKQFLKLVTLTC